MGIEVKSNQIVDVLKKVSLIIGIISIFYYIVLTLYIGLRMNFNLFWLIISFSNFGLTFFLRKEEKFIRKHKAIGYVLLCAFLLFIFIFSVIEGIIVNHANSMPHKDADYMIVLGAQVKKTVVSKSLKQRLDAAYDYLIQNDSTKVVVSGGKGPGEDISEGEAMRQYLVERGISSERIFVEDNSTNTHENILFSKQFVEDGKSVIIVTNGFHVYRGMSIAKKQGMKKIEGLGAKTDRILLINFYVREGFGVLKDTLFGNM